jgi:hypothetical protein
MQLLSGKLEPATDTDADYLCLSAVESFARQTHCLYQEIPCSGLAEGMLR